MQDILRLTVDLAKVGRFSAVACLIEIINEDGTMARLPQLVEIAQEHQMKLISIADLIKYRLKTESIVEKGTCPPSTLYGDFDIILPAR